MLKKFKRKIAILLSLVMVLGCSFSSSAAGTTDTESSEDVTVINLFDPNDPNLIKIVEAEAIERTTSRPTAYWNFDVNGSVYNYSAHSNNNIMWTKYIFFDPGNLNRFEIKATNYHTNYRMIFHDVSDGKEYYYNIPSTNVVFRTEHLWGGNLSDTFYFGIDTTASKTEAFVNGYVKRY